MEYFIVLLFSLKMLTVVISATVIHYSMKYKKCKGIDFRKIKQNEERLGSIKDARLEGKHIHAVKYSLN